MVLSILAFALAGCMKSESDSESSIITYTYEISENLYDMVDCTVMYIDQDRKMVSESMNSNRWEKKIEVRRPFYAEMQIKCKRKGLFIPTKDYYTIHRKLMVNESVFYGENTISKRGLDEYIESLCHHTQTIFFEIK